MKIDVESENTRAELFKIIDKVNETFDISLSNFINNKMAHPNDLATFIMNILVNVVARNIVKMDDCVRDTQNKKGKLKPLQSPQETIDKIIPTFMASLVTNLKGRINNGAKYIYEVD